MLYYPAPCSPVPRHCLLSCYFCCIATMMLFYNDLIIWQMFLVHKINWQTGNVSLDSSWVLSLFILVLVRNVALWIVSMLFADSFIILNQLNQCWCIEAEIFWETHMNMLCMFQSKWGASVTEYFMIFITMSYLAHLLMLQNLVKHVYVTNILFVVSMSAWRFALTFVWYKKHSYYFENLVNFVNF